MVSDAVLSAEEMLARAAANVRSGNTTANQSAVQKLLSQRENPLPEDTVELSPVQKILQAQQAEADSVESYFESDAFLQLKINQLRGQLALYSTLPGLDPNGGVIAGIEAEIRAIIEEQQATLQATLAEADAKQAELAEQDAARANTLPSADDLLARVRGEAPAEELSSEVQALLERAKGAVVDTTA